MFRVKILPLAKQDILEAAHWYNEKQNGLGKAFTLKVRSKVDFIIQNPLVHSVRYDEMHCAVLETFPFMIHYLIDKKAKTIIITAVFHTSMNPAKWKSRKK